MRWEIVLLVVLAGCPGAAPGDDTVDAPDAPPTDPTALRLEWRILPAIPGDAGAGITVERVRLDVTNLRVVGDAGAVERGSLDVDWEQDMVPPRVDFSDPPPGIYSRIVFALEGHGDEDESVEIRGTCLGDEDYLIEDLGPVEISLDIGIVLLPGDDLTQVIELELAGALQEINYADLPVRDGRRLLDKEVPQAETFRAALRGSFAPIGVPMPTN